MYHPKAYGDRLSFSYQAFTSNASGRSWARKKIEDCYPEDESDVPRLWMYRDAIDRRILSLQRLKRLAVNLIRSNPISPTPSTSLTRSRAERNLKFVHARAPKDKPKSPLTESEVLLPRRQC